MGHTRDNAWLMIGMILFWWVGGAASNLQILDDQFFSRHHFLIQFNPPRVFLRDVGSRSGTFVNGKRVSQCDLGDGDIISAGRSRMLVRLSRPGTEITASHIGSKEDGDFVMDASFADTPRKERPDTVPGYRLGRKLGEGGMGEVYLAQPLAGGAEVAIKLMLPETAASERAMQLFLREVSVLGKLDHPNIVSYREMGTALGQFYFVMEYVQAVPLAAHCANLLPPRRLAFVVALIRQALEGVGYAHGRGIVHRDLKPGNLLVEAGPNGRAKVADFGLAKSFQNAGFSGMTFSGQVMGTLAFMAPEQLIDCRGAKPAADIYALGATAYSLLAGRHPLEVRKGNPDPIRVLLEDEPPLLSSLCPWVPKELAAVIHRALQKQPADRFADAASMQQALAPWEDA